MSWILLVQYEVDGLLQKEKGTNSTTLGQVDDAYITIVK